MYTTIILDGQQYIQQSTFITRDYALPLDLLKLDKIISFVGARRVGKTTIMKQVLKNLIDIGYIGYNNIIRIDANEINPLTFDMGQLLESYFQLYPDLKPFIVIDEVHELPDWVRQLFVAYNKGYKIFISGSNAHLLSSEISTKLRGKVYDQHIYGLSWSEYQRFTDTIYHQSTQGKGIQKALFEEYLTYGGFPEVVLSSDHAIKHGLLKNYFDVLLYKDLIERYNIDKEFVVKYLIKYLLSTITKEFSVTKFINQLKSQSISITKPSIYNYLEYLQNIFFIYPVQQQYKQRGSIKYYLNDIGYIQLQEKESTGKRFENYIINHYKQSQETINFMVTTGGEIDLVIQDTGIQICRDLNADNLQKETDSLLRSTYPTKRLIYHTIQPGLIVPQGIKYLQVFDIIENTKR